MELIPAIDVLGGRIVRLHQGRYDDATFYELDPVVYARALRDAGARRLHVVDLDGARDGAPRNVTLVSSIVQAAGLEAQVGGGIRSAETAEAWLDGGASRVVLGTAAVRDPALVARLCAAHPGRIVAAIDARQGEVAVAGWLEGTGRTAADVAAQMDEVGICGVLFTAIERDGTGEGPDVAATAALQSQLRAEVIASGGIGSIAHLESLARAGVRAAVCGKALLDGRFTYADARARLESL